jgi:hypothetical protein
MDAIIQWANDNASLVAVVAFLLGGGAAWPVFRRYAALSPNKLDDAIVSALDPLIGARQERIEQLSAEFLEKRLTDRQVVEIVKLRKAAWAAAKQKAGTG